MKIVLLNGHPYDKSFCDGLASEYERGARDAGHTVDRVDVRDLKFDMVLRYGYSHRMELEPDLVRQQELIKACEHLVIVVPFWWAGVPALLKGYFDRILLPNFAFECEGNKCKGMLSGKSASVIYTQDAPFFWTFLAYRDSFWSSLKHAILKFCGFSPIKRKYFTGVRKSSDEQRQKWLKEVYELGKNSF